MMGCSDSRYLNSEYKSTVISLSLITDIACIFTRNVYGYKVLELPVWAMRQWELWGMCVAPWPP